MMCADYGHLENEVYALEAGGKSERLVGYDKPKQFIEIVGRQIISYSPDIFDKCKEIDVICVVADEKWRSQIGGYLFADPGISRRHSIYNGLTVLENADALKLDSYISHRYKFGELDKAFELIHNKCEKQRSQFKRTLMKIRLV